MTGSELLDARRNIRKELVAFISIVMIGLLAALAYLGIAYSAAALKQDALIFFNDRELWDVEVTSTMLMTDEDLEEIRALPGVGEAERVWQIDTRLHLGNRKTAVSVVSLPEKMSLPARTTSATWSRSRRIFLCRRTPSTGTVCAAPS